MLQRAVDEYLQITLGDRRDQVLIQGEKRQVVHVDQGVPWKTCDAVSAQSTGKQMTHCTNKKLTQNAKTGHVKSPILCKTT